LRWQENRRQETAEKVRHMRMQASRVLGDFPGATCWGSDSPSAARARTGPNEAPAHGFSGGALFY